MRLRVRLRKRSGQDVLPVLADILGRLLENEHTPDPDATFLELGADSVTLMQTLPERMLAIINPDMKPV